MFLTKWIRLCQALPDIDSRAYILFCHFSIVRLGIRLAIVYRHGALFIGPFGENSFVEVHEYGIERLHLAVENAFHVAVCSCNPFGGKARYSLSIQCKSIVHNIGTHPTIP